VAKIRKTHHWRNSKCSHHLLIPKVTEKKACSFARESMHLQMTRDALGDEDIPDEILKRELALDKELVQLIQTACKNDKLPRVLELTLLLHHTSSFDMAMKVAAFYRLVGLQEKIQALKDDRIARGRPQKRDWTRDYDPMLPTRLPPADIPRGGEPKVFQNFGPPVPVHRPGLARATPSLPPPPKDDVWNEDYAVTAAVPGESKRKRADDDSIAYGDAEQPDSIKRRVVEDDEYALPLPSKPSAHVLFLFFPQSYLSVAYSCSRHSSSNAFG
jgi:chromosome transmission fidelity protein 4